MKKEFDAALKIISEKGYEYAIEYLDKDFRERIEDYVEGVAWAVKINPKSLSYVVGLEEEHSEVRHSINDYYFTYNHHEISNFINLTIIYTAKDEYPDYSKYELIYNKK